MINKTRNPRYTGAFPRYIGAGIRCIDPYTLGYVGLPITRHPGTCSVYIWRFKVYFASKTLFCYHIAIRHASVKMFLSIREIETVLASCLLAALLSVSHLHL